MDHHGTTPAGKNGAAEIRVAPSLHVTRRSEHFVPDYGRVITKIFRPGGSERIRHVINRVLDLDEATVKIEFEEVVASFEHRHRNFRRSLREHFKVFQHYLPANTELSDERLLLLGACFTHEYSISAAAMFNPSMIAAPNQVGLADGDVRFVMSFRTTGEGHISSIVFREGVILADGSITFEPISQFLEIPEVSADANYDKTLFSRKLNEMGADNEVSDEILSKVSDNFTIAELEQAVASLKGQRILPRTAQKEAISTVLWLARSNYTIRFPANHAISERVIFPVSDNESRGIEDARFVRFVDDDGYVRYVATYTAYNGFRILPQLIYTDDFVTFKISTLNGRAAQDKGMALFPRRVNGKYAMIGRQDGENLYIMFSDNMHFWHEAALLQTPEKPWELIQIGNNGSPIETPEGWLLLTHGVGPMREYCIGCTLLDLEDPSIVLGSLDMPLIAPNVDEREGYVPNVVYSCGAMLHGGKMVIPYAMSDSRSGIATVPVEALLEAILNRHTVEVVTDKED